jgi:hypothetical protein
MVYQIKTTQSLFASITIHDIVVGFLPRNRVHSLCYRSSLHDGNSWCDLRRIRHHKLNPLV